MKTTVVIVIAGVLVNAVGTAEPKEVNIALETVLRFDKKDQTPGLTVIDNVQDALERFKHTLINRRRNPSPMTFTDVGSRRSNSRDMTFTDFVLQAAKILNGYDDNNLEDVFAVIQSESRRYISRDSGLQDVLGSSDVRRLLSKQLGAFEDVPAKMLRRHLDKVISAVENKIKTGEKNDILDVGNFLYIGESEKLRAALKSLERLRRTNDGHVEVVLRDTLWSLVFDHYSNLNNNIKRELIEMAKDYWRVYSRNDDKYTPVSSLVPTGVTRFDLKDRIKNRAYPDMRQMSIVQPITVNRNKYNKAVHKNKRYTNKFRIPKVQKITPTDSKLVKFNSKTRLLSALRMRSTPPPKSESSDVGQDMSSYETSGQENTYLKSIKYKSKTNKLTPAHSYEKTKVLREYKAKSKEGDSAQSDFMIVTGGQNMGDTSKIGGKGEPSSGEFSKQSKNNEDEKHTLVETDKQETDTVETDTVEKDTVEKDTVEKNTVGNASVEKDTVKKRSVERVIRPFISIEKFTTEHSSIEEVGVIKGNRFAVTAGLKNKGASGEGLAIKSFENELSIEQRNMRKSNALDIFEPKDPETPDVKKIIQHIQKQIKNVEEEVSYVKNLSICKHKPNEPKFKSVDSNETSFYKAKNRYRYRDSDSIEKDNDAFFSRGVFENFGADKPASHFDFRANENGNGTNAPVIDRKQNDTKITVMENTTAKTSALTHIINETAHIINETKTNMTSGSTLIANHIKTDDNQNISEITKVESLNKSNKTDNNSTNNAKQLLIEMFDMKLNEIDTTNKTMDKIIEENYVMVPQSKGKVNGYPKSQLDDFDIESIMANSIDNIYQ